MECADAARADYLVTGNQEHFPKFQKKTRIITPRGALALSRLIESSGVRLTGVSDEPVRIAGEEVSGNRLAGNFFPSLVV